MNEDEPVEIPISARCLSSASTAGVEALLRHLAEIGFTSAPRTLGRDERGRQAGVRRGDALRVAKDQELAVLRVGDDDRELVFGRVLYRAAQGFEQFGHE